MKKKLIFTILLVLVTAAVCISPVTAEVYNPADFTVAASGPDLSPEDLFESANATLNNYTALFGKTVTPIALSDSSLSPESLNLRSTLSGSALSVSPMSAGYLGIPPVIVADTEKLSAYGFRGLPTGQTMTYALSFPRTRTIQPMQQLRRA